ncbi:MAG: hypothetical protein FD181_3650 [Prolixibacteraceae bacterium]|nr:MAG: hypothetical protein FD181_3650 [Prolixibacteraceae bacterium]
MFFTNLFKIRKNLRTKKSFWIKVKFLFHPQPHHQCFLLQRKPGQPDNPNETVQQN